MSVTKIEINEDFSDMPDFNPEEDVAYIGYALVCDHCGAQVLDGEEKDIKHHTSCTPYYPENPDLSDEERLKHGLLTNAQMDYWNNVTEKDIENGTCEPPPDPPRSRMFRKGVKSPHPWGSDGHKLAKLDIATKRCPFCSKILGSPDAVARHIRDKHPAMVDPNFNW